MKRPRLVVLLSFGIAGLGCASLLGAEAVVPDLKKVSEGIGALAAPTAAARWDVDVTGKGSTSAPVRTLSALFTRGVIWLEGLTFSDGTIEVDILGKSAPRGSNFLGVAFRGEDDTTFDCVYFRPFNFRAENPENASHAVQYISHPQWTWKKLRAEKPGHYEQSIVPSPDGDAWLHAKIVVEGKKVSVFVNGAETPSLAVETLNDRTSGRVGIWGGDAGDGGHFANLTITPRGQN